MSKIQSHSTDSHSDDCMSLSVSVVSQRHGQSRGVNLYVFHVSLTDFHCFDWLTYVRGNPYGFIKKKKKKI